MKALITGASGGLVSALAHKLAAQGKTLMLAGRDRQAVEEEVADVLLYLLRLTDVLGIDPLRAAQRKLAVNARKYPVAVARGSARKYSRR